MSLPYILLSIAVLASLFVKNKNIVVVTISWTVFAAFTNGTINIYGILSLFFFASLCHYYFENQSINKLFKVLLFGLICFCITGFAFHFIPGFFNAHVITNLQLSPLSYPFSTYMNFDKTIAALILYTTSNLYSLQKPLDKDSLFITFKTLLAAFLVILVPALLFKYVTFDPKLTNAFWIWELNNFLFVCMAEEVMCRGFLQNHLKIVFKSNYLHIILAGLIFGIAHFEGGLVYIGLSWLAGILYGYAYDKTSRIMSSMIVHCGINSIHFIFFTYPAAI